MMRIHRIEEVVEDPATAEALKPWYMFMCKRPCFDDEYLPAFNRPTSIWWTPMARGSPRSGPRGRSSGGRTYPLDLLVYATGFEVQKTGIYNRIVGHGGVDLNRRYEEAGIRTTHRRRRPARRRRRGLQLSVGYQTSPGFASG